MATPDVANVGLEILGIKTWTHQDATCKLRYSPVESHRAGKKTLTCHFLVLTGVNGDEQQCTVKMSHPFFCSRKTQTNKKLPRQHRTAAAAVNTPSSAVAEAAVSPSHTNTSPLLTLNCWSSLRRFGVIWNTRTQPWDASSHHAVSHSDLHTLSHRAWHMDEPTDNLVPLVFFFFFICLHTSSAFSGSCRRKSFSLKCLLLGASLQ